MVTLRPQVRHRFRRRTKKDGTVVTHVRWFVLYRDPRTGERRLPSFPRKKDAEDYRNKLIADYHAGSIASPKSAKLTVADAVGRWLANRAGEVRDRTLRGYKESAKYIVGPIVRGTRQQRYDYSTSTDRQEDTQFIHLLGPIRINELTTGDIREWHKMLATEVGLYTARRAKMFLKTSLGLAAEDFNIRPPAMPTLLGKGPPKPRKAILEPLQVRAVLEAAENDHERGIYVAFPFLAGTRPSEQLGLLWREVDFEKNIIRIVRTQSDKGQLIESTKTQAGTREIPMGPQLRTMLLAWKLRCPRLAGELYRVFPGLGRIQAWPKPRLGAGGTLEYHNFLARIWRPFFQKNELPYVTPHSARHTFISVLQMQGIEVGLVAKIAGHSNPNVTLGHYTQAMRGGAEAAAALEKAFG